VWKLHVTLLDDARETSAGMPDRRGFERELSLQVGDFLLQSTHINGIAGVTEATVRETSHYTVDSRGAVVCTKEDVLDVAGSVFAELLALPNIDALRTTSNDPVEVLETLGIEAAASVLASELVETLCFDGRFINFRHIMVTVDTMTVKGYLMPFSRHGINKCESSVLSRASFEQTVDTLFEAAAFGELDRAQGVAVKLMIGELAGIGSGTIDIVQGDCQPDTQPQSYVYSRLAVQQRQQTKKSRNFVHSRMSYQSVLHVPSVLALTPCRTIDVATAPEASDLVSATGSVDMPFVSAPPEIGPRFLDGTSLMGFIHSRRVASLQGLNNL
jgi:hypothetical protein